MCSRNRSTLPKIYRLPDPSCLPPPTKKTICQTPPVLEAHFDSGKTPGNLAEKLHERRIVYAADVADMGHLQCNHSTIAQALLSCNIHQDPVVYFDFTKMYYGLALAGLHVGRSHPGASLTCAIFPTIVHVPPGWTRLQSHSHAVFRSFPVIAERCDTR